MSTVESSLKPNTREEVNMRLSDNVKAVQAINMLTIDQAKESGKSMCKGPEAGGTEINVKDQEKTTVTGVRENTEDRLRGT